MVTRLTVIGPDADPDVHDRGFIGGGDSPFYIRPMGPHRLGHVEPPHLHQIDHILHFVRGRALMSHWHESEDRSQAKHVLLARPGAKWLMRRDRWHELIAVEDGTLWECWFARIEAEAMYGTDSVIATSNRWTAERMPNG